MYFVVESFKLNDLNECKNQIASEMSMVNQTNSPSETNEDDLIDHDTPVTKKILEEDEYLNRISKIIRKNFFPDIEFSNDVSDTPKTYSNTDVTGSTYHHTPSTDRTHLSSASSFASHQAPSNLNLNEFFERYTSEDNAYFENLQKKEIRRHRSKYPWLYDDKSDHNKRIREQLELPSIREQASSSGSGASTKMIDWPHNPKNTLFYAPDKNSTQSNKPQSTINYRSNKCMNEPYFKQPLLPTNAPRPKVFTGFADKIGIDGKLANGSETPSINGYSFIPAPETTKPTLLEPRVKSEANRFYIPSESPRDELAHRVYQEKVAKVTRTPKKESSGTPSSRVGYASFSFSPERVKNLTPSLRRHK